MGKKAAHLFHLYVV